MEDSKFFYTLYHAGKMVPSLGVPECCLSPCRRTGRFLRFVDCNDRLGNQERVTVVMTSLQLLASATAFEGCSVTHSDSPISIHVLRWHSLREFCLAQVI